MPKLGAEKERLAREILRSGTFDGDGGYDPDNAEEDNGQHERRDERKDKDNLHT